MNQTKAVRVYNSAEISVEVVVTIDLELEQIHSAEINMSYGRGGGIDLLSIFKYLIALALDFA